MSGLPTIDARCSMKHIGSSKSCADDGAYQMVGSCSNCKSQVAGTFTIGHEAASGWNSPTCPVCGCSGHVYWTGLADAAAVGGVTGEPK